jgi:hypothetical protein
LSEGFIATITDQLQKYRGEDVEALVVGSDTLRDTRIVQIFSIDTNGVISCCDDVGFGAIGSGAWHAKSSLMQSRYVNTVRYASALALTYTAKKAADIAPGVGPATDLFIVFRNGAMQVPTSTTSQVSAIHNDYLNKRRVLGTDAIAQLQSFLDTPTLDLRDKDDGTQRILGANAQANASATSASPEAARKNESGTSET